MKSIWRFRPPPRSAGSSGLRHSILIAVDDGVGDRTLGDDAGDVTDAGARRAVKHDRSARPMALQPCERHAQKVLVTADHDPALDKFFHLDVGIGARLEPQPGARWNQPDDPPFPLHHDGAYV